MRKAEFDEKANRLATVLWAKSNPYKSIFQHGRETAIVAKAILKRSNLNADVLGIGEKLGISEDEAIKLTMYTAATHDIGKISPIFTDNKNLDFVDEFFRNHPECKLPVAEIFHDFRHEIESAMAAERIWKTKNRFSNVVTRKSLATVLRVHHQGKSGSAPDLCGLRDEFAMEEKNGGFNGDFWLEQQEIFEKKMYDWINPPSFDLNRAVEGDAALMLITAIVIISDWIASGDIFNDIAENTSEEELWSRAVDFLNRAGLTPPALHENKDFCSVWQDIPKDSRRPLQRCLDDFFAEKKENTQPQLLIIEAPMGEGKTEAGIFAALKLQDYWHKEGFYIALPTAATSNQMAARVNRLLEKHGSNRVKLLHSMAWLYNGTLEDMEFNLGDEEDRTQAEMWTSSAKRALLSPLAVGTVDQAMMAAMYIKYGVLRLAGLAGKVLIIDEIHAYDVYMSEIIMTLLEWCRALSVPVIMLSATLPQLRKAKILERFGVQGAGNRNGQTAYPLITAAYQDGRLEELAVPGSYQKNEVFVKLLPCLNDVERIAETAAGLVSAGGCICVLVNTVAEAQKIYQQLKQKADKETRLMLFHSRFSAGRRNEIENECVRIFGPLGVKTGIRPEKAILVATQVVEQSLDIDMDVMLTAIAPIDLLLQRMGRMHRHEQTPRPNKLCKPEMLVLIPAESEGYGATESIYYKFLLDRTRKALIKRASIKVPEDIPLLVEQIYAEELTDEDMTRGTELEAFYTMLFQEEMKAAESTVTTLSSPKKNKFCFDVMTSSPFVGDDEDPLIQARTRLSEKSHTIAIVPEDLYDEIKNSERPGTTLARKTLLYSVSITERQFRELSLAKDTSVIAGGRGQLSHVYIIRESSGCGSGPQETLRALTGEWEIVLDREMGFLYNKRGG